jgi:hypothetical protein
MTYTSRKPYLKLKKSLVEFFTAPTRHLKDVVTKESQFEKPYLDSEYPQMHLDMPIPDWPTPKPIPPIKPPGPKRRFTPVDGGEKPLDECSGCTLVVHETHSSHCEDWPASIHPSQYCTTDHFVGRDCKLTISVIAGKLLKELPGLFGWPTSRDLLFDSTIENHEVLVEMIDGGGFYCSKTLKQHCIGCSCASPPEGALSFDDASTPDTIVKNSSITVYVTGGCGPFTFATSSLGYTFDGGVTSLETENRFATLSCVDGTCGTNFAANVAYTITDNCGVVVSGKAMNTAGTWGSWTDYCGTSGYTLGYRYGIPLNGVKYRMTIDRRCEGPWRACDTCSEMIASGEYGWPNADGEYMRCAPPKAVACSTLKNNVIVYYKDAYESYGRSDQAFFIQRSLWTC